jgi:hypothetical protein
MLSSCSSGSGSSSGAGTAREPRVEPADLLKSGPLNQAIGSPFVADQDSAWYSDFKRLARFDVKARTWSTVALPGGKGRIDSLAFAPDGSGGLRAVIGACASTCEEGVERTLGAWSVTPELDVRPLGLDVKVSDGVIVTAVPGGQLPRFLVADGTTTTLVTLAGKTASTETVVRPIPLLCGTDDGLIGVEVDPAAGAALAPRTIVAGPSLTKLQPVTVSDAQTTPLGSPDTSTLCGPGGTLALVGPDQASEYRSGTWNAVPSDVNVALGPQRPSGAMATVRGRTVQAGTVANLARDDQGWHLAAQGTRPSGYALVGTQIVSYPEKR